ncbi:hypothetical protein [Streptomyces sp. NPDC020951]
MHLKRDAERRDIAHYIGELGVTAVSGEQEITKLSGGIRGYGNSAT